MPGCALRNVAGLSYRVFLIAIHEEPLLPLIKIVDPILLLQLRRLPPVPFSH